MSASNEPAKFGNEISEQLVREYLVEHGDFLQRNPDLMDHLHINHASGSAVSLVERQVSVLRERNIDMRRRLNALTSNARDNDQLYQQTRNLVLRLLEANSVAALFDHFLDAMHQEFGVEHASMILFDEDPDTLVGGRFEDPAVASEVVGALLRGRKAICGTLREEELSYLFPNAGAVGSAAVMPLYKNGDLGLIAVGSSDANRYGSDMGTVFLSHIAEVIIRLLPRWPR
jgi:uncharacterized protein YigA (DUF484 family)